MHIDARELDDGAVIQGDVCIVGAGAAGISMALEWANSSRRVLLLEGGGFDFDPRMQDLYRGQNIGETYYPMESARLHYFGGTTGHWAGFCSPFDAIDFETRDWVPNSGWPISLDDLHPYYSRAQALLELGPYEYGAEYWEAQDEAATQMDLGDRFWTKMWQFSPPTRFGTKYRDAIVDSPNIELFTYANVCEIQANETATTIDGLRVRTLEGNELTARAQVYVLACGAIQNARLLLVSNRQAPNGLGNDNDLVGRHFMEHLEMPGANLILSQPQTLKFYVAPLRFAATDTRARGELSLSAAAQRELRVLNGTAAVLGGFWGDGIRTAADRMAFVEDARAAMRAGEVSTSGEQIDYEANVEFRLATRFEQAPNPDSRVTLNDEVDAMGMRRVNLNWRMTELDQVSIRRFLQLLGETVGALDLGRLQLADWLLDDDDLSWPSFVSGGWHHMGTARMHESPRSGVVDANCKVHGIDNLYVAGSAAFATSAAPNPTLTIVALSLRLSDYLKAQFA